MWPDHKSSTVALMRKLVVCGADGNFGAIAADTLLSLVPAERVRVAAPTVEGTSRYREAGVGYRGHQLQRHRRAHRSLRGGGEGARVLNINGAESLTMADFAAIGNEVTGNRRHGDLRTGDP